MRTKTLGIAVTLACALVVAGCSSGPDTPGQEDLRAQLQKEAETLKAQNENQDTDIGVKATWRIMSVDVVEQPGNEKAPWRGKITFKIRSETSDMGKVDVHEFDKEFPYVFNPTLQKWIYSAE